MQQRTPLPVHLASLPCVALKQAPSELGKEGAESPVLLSTRINVQAQAPPVAQAKDLGCPASASAQPSYRRLSLNKPSLALALRTQDLARKEGAASPPPQLTEILLQ